ncbi:MAG: hypothetical protein EBZ77_02995 [Chitinophagia bacterium]|nr:hypothetical protein [Chitinophagia bacterium]
MMHRITKITLLAILLAAGCRTKDRALAGKGGQASLVVTPQHHLVTKNLVQMKVYIRYNSLEAPSGNVYDDSANCTTSGGVSTATFTGLNNGDYYIFGQGYDTSVKQPVRGGMPFSISVQTTQTASLPVSEY